MSKKANQFDFIANADEAQTSESRKLQHTNMLIAESKTKAVEVMQFVAKQTDDLKTEYADMIRSGKAEDLIKLITTAVSEERIVEDAKFLSDCSEEEFSKLLESRRSDRSKKLKEGPLSNVSTCQSYIGAMYAELLVRQAWGKPYNASSSDTVVDEKDLIAVGKKIRSLQSKKSRLTKSAKYDEADRIELEAVTAEIARLNKFRPTISSTTVIKSADAETVREALASLDQSKLSPEILAQLQKANLI